MNKCTILILTYKGKRHLEYLLPTVAVAIDNYVAPQNIEVLIVDNGRDEETKKFSNDNFPSFRYEFSPVNDYLFSLNPYVAALDTEFVLILNDDMKLHPDVLNQLLPVIANDPKLFAVNCRIMDWDGTYTASAVRMATYTRGWFKHFFGNPEENEIKYTLYAGGGAAIFRTKMFNEIGGFDSLYRPAYCEDADLSMAAWQKGWHVIYHPKAILYHREGGTIGDQYKRDKLTLMVSKNNILLMVKNVRIRGFMFWFFALMPYRLLVNFVKNRIQYKAMMASIPLMAEALAKRNKIVPVVDDTAWLSLINKPYKTGTASE